MVTLFKSILIYKRNNYCKSKPKDAKMANYKDGRVRALVLEVALVILKMEE